MSKAAAATADVAVDVPKKGKKKLIIILAAVLVLVLGGGGGAMVMMKKKAAEEAATADEEDGDAPVAKAHAKEKKHDAKHPPVFVPLEPFVVNLADKESDRYAQIGVTIEVDDPKVAEEMKTYMPAIRNGILMVLAHKTSAQLLQREGKLALSREIMREAGKPMGFEVDEEEAAPAADAHDGDDEDAPKKKKKRKKAAPESPIKSVYFSNFIVQ